MLLGLCALSTPAAADTGPQLYGFCWVVGESTEPHMRGLSHFTTLVFPYDRWHLDGGRFFQTQFEAFARSTRAFKAPAARLVCEKEDSQEKAITTFKQRIQESGASAKADVVYLSWVPTARLPGGQAEAVPVPVAASALAPTPTGAAVPAPVPPSFGPLDDVDTLNVALFRESDCAGLVTHRASIQQRARDLDQELVNARDSLNKGSKKEKYVQIRQETAARFQRSLDLLEFVRSEKRCAGVAQPARAT
ncbi:MAG: hypothetical protein RL227_2636 [Pseudomonadota bacterium]